ncbi:s-adenosylmethionine-dependent methyltransferase, yral family [Limosilactobacillus frumenti DSM 13145]|uniref:Ribosomal RNA small subunit methyltransferase I n=1 Tax=Limosilactobacillus frumenti DSM 13145 TaxID=1423746 RepID=A0A0R1PHK4_9LACO|nr:16S rRNA (cytidine(1402)-2'-O)-methyltransferase [Limosilactobacillus frumenti]KRL28379.1 s-adenosylmethionine-dependent methyltransferase, yral family [Limosilactobacillus frumenti DSM 13145]QFG72171.1 16S rRNA (cytidine(1402)-2'-O)-methyltransferase [Limosilactobacillus frumenti]
MQQVSSFRNADEGRLYLVPTPIGNLDDMTFRAVKTLRDVDLIAAEDTRHTQQLLNHFDIHTPQISFHEHNTESRIPELMAKLRDGMQIAQCSDAGMPSISDPGKELVAAATAASIPVVPLPGPNAGLTALIASGLVPQPFYFFGFLERKHQQQAATLTTLKNRPETMIFYEAPHRLVKTLAVMTEVLGGERPVVIARELTKRYEEFTRGTLAEVHEYFKNHQIKGEFVIIVQGNEHPEEDNDNQQGTPMEQIDRAIADGLTTNAAIKLVAKQNGLNRQKLYKQYHHI